MRFKKPFLVYWILSYSSTLRTIQLIAIYEKCFSSSSHFSLPSSYNSPKRKFLQHKSLCLKSCFAIIMVISISTLSITANTQYTIHRGVWIRHEAALFDVQYSSFALNYTEAHFARHSCDLITLVELIRNAQLKLWL